MRSCQSRAWAALSIVSLFLAATAVVVLDAAPASATTVSVANATEFRAALADVNVDHIDLTATIEMDCPGATQGSPGTSFTRSNTTVLTIDGHGFAITETGCFAGVLRIAANASLTLQNTTISGGNKNFTGAPSGAGIETSGPLTLDHTTVTFNFVTGTIGAGGSAIVSFASSVTLIDSSVYDNHASCSACNTSFGISGAITAGAATVTLLRSTVRNNASVGTGLAGSIGEGGGMLANNVSLIHSTVSNNSLSMTNGSTRGGGIEAISNVSLVASTVTDNTAQLGANIEENSGSASFASFGSVIASPQGGGANCFTGVELSQGYNWITDASCNLVGTGDHSSAADPGLSVLGDNGGPTFTRLPTATSGLIDQIPAGSCLANGALAFDQRGVNRPNHEACDIGSVEVADGLFTPVVPFRLLNTKANLGHTGALGPSQSLDLDVTGGPSGVPPSGVSAVVMNVTATAPTASGYLTVWPTGATRPVTSNLNFSPGETIPNLVTVKVGTAGQVSIFNGVGTTHVVADIVGWYSDPTVAPGSGSRLVPVVPYRVLNTKVNLGHTGPVGAGQHFDLQVTGTGGPGGVPNSGTVTAVVINVTATAPTASSYLTVYPTGAPQPLASNLNFTPGETIPNLVVVGMGTGGKVSIFNGVGTTHVVGDVVGYFTNTAPVGSSRLQPLVPARILNTKVNLGHNGAVGAGQHFDLQVTSQGGVPASGVAAVVINITATAPTASSYLTVYPTGAAVPLASNLNFTPGETIPNLVVVGVGTGGKISIFNGVGSTHVVGDVVGWYASP